MQSKVAWVVGLVIAVGAGAIFLVGYNDGKQASGVQTPDTAGPTYTWQINEATSTDEAMPRSRVSIAFNQEVREVGTYDGTCSVQTTDLLPNEESKVVCWFAGGGSEIGVFNENGVKVIKVGDLDEGSAEEAGFRGNFRTVLDL